MSSELIGRYIGQFGYKRLSGVEADPMRSNQHELNGVAALREMLGDCRSTWQTTFVYLNDEQEEAVIEQGQVTWYDAREANPTRSEWRLYYPTNEVTSSFAEDMLLVIGMRSDRERELLFITVDSGSAVERQLQWLFDIEDGSNSIVMGNAGVALQEVDYTTRSILSAMGVDAFVPMENYLQCMLERFGGRFPNTAVFSAFARSTVEDVEPVIRPDVTLMAWLDREEVLFRTLENHLLEERIHRGFNSVDEFVMESLSVQNRRKARAGRALENHAAELFRQNRISFSTGVQTENRAKPDFLFPDIANYRDNGFAQARLTMLGAKTTCKDRWRQVLTEAARIPNKHLLTLEPGISVNQTNEMRSHGLQLVVPQRVHDTYLPSQQEWLMNVAAFVELVRGRQREG